MLKQFLVGVIGVSLAFGAFAKGDPKKGQAKSETCVACHGTDGNGDVPLWPKIAGQQEIYLKNQLKAYQAGEQGNRHDPNMYGMVVGLSDDDIEDLAAFYASQKTKIGKTKAHLFELGQKIYRGGNIKTGVSACGACHGPAGQGSILGHFPKLSGQHAEYTVQQLKLYKEGKRKTDPNAIMRSITQRMTDEEIEAVSSYVEGLH